MIKKIFGDAAPETINAISDLSSSTIALVILGVFLFFQIRKDRKIQEEQSKRLDKVIDTFKEEMREARQMQINQENKHSKDRDEWVKKVESLYKMLFNLAEENKKSAIRQEEKLAQATSAIVEMAIIANNCKKV